MADQNNLNNQQNLNEAYKAGRETLQSIAAELGRQKTITSQAAAEYTKMDNILKRLQDRQGDISNLSAKEIENLKKKYELSLSENQALADKLAKDKNLRNLTEQQIQFKLKSTKLSDKERELLNARLDGFKIEREILEDINKDLQRREEYETKIKDLTGATGAALNGMKGIMDGLGASSLSNYLNIDAAKEAMQAEADAIARGEKEGGALQVRMAGIKALAEGLNKTLFSTEAIFGFIAKELEAGSKNAAEFQKQTGMSKISAHGLNLEMKGIAIASGDNFITSEKLNKSFAMLTSELGVSADILGGEALVSATNLEQRLGMSAQQAGKLTVFTRLQGKNTEDILQRSSKIVGAYNKQNKTAINTRAVLDDVANTSTATFLTMGKNVEALTQAATQAQALGLNMKQVEQIADSLLNFEDSIGKELEAQLLTGGNINLAKAREYAMTGDMVGLTTEIQKQEGIMNAFRTKNVYAQKAAAEALGISRDELANMALKQDLATMSAEQFKDAYGETTYESMKARSASEKFADVMGKVKDILGSIVQVFSPILDVLAWVLANPITPYLLGAVVVAKVLGSSVGKIGSAFKGMYDMGKQALTGIADLFKKGNFKEAVGGLKDKLMGGAADKTKDIADKAGGADEKKGGGVKGFLKGLGDGLASIGKKFGDVVKGAIALGIAGVAIAGGLAIAMMIIKDVDPAKMLAFTGAISMLGITLAIMGKIGGDVIKGALALGLVGLALIPAAYAFSMLKDVDTNKMIAFSIAVPLLALAAAGLGFLIGPILAGSLALAALGVGLIAVGAGFMVLSNGAAGLELFNQLLSIVAEKGIGAGIGLAAVGVGMGVLGIAGKLSFPGIILASVALGAIGLSLKAFEQLSQNNVLPSIATSLMQIALVAPALLGVGAALFGIAAGLGAVALAGLAAIPAIGGLIMLSKAAPALVSLGIGAGEKTAGAAKGKSEEGSMAAVEKKLDELIAAVKAGGNVYMDSNKVGRAQVLGTFKSV